MKQLLLEHISQTPRYPTGCESVSAVMLLHHVGISIPVDTFIQHYLPQQSFWQEGAKTFGPNPNLAFAGSPYDPDAFGCYAPVIAAALNQAFQDYQAPYHAVLATGTPLPALCRCTLDRDLPAVVWACLNMRPPIHGPSWYLADGSLFHWTSNEHCLLLTGYDDTRYFFHDPHENNGNIGFPKPLVHLRHRAQGSQAVRICPLV